MKYSLKKINRFIKQASPAVSFLDLPYQNWFKSYTIFLDLDGTLLPDGYKELSVEVKNLVRELKKNNQVLLCSNGNYQRSQKIANELDIEQTQSGYKKPSIKVYDSKQTKYSDILVIGDKWLTDGLFAFKLKAKFIPIISKRSGKESIHIRLIYLVDVLLYKIILILCRIFSYFWR